MEVKDLISRLGEKPAIISELPSTVDELDEPRIYLSEQQAEVCKKYPKLEHLAAKLPGWVRQSLIADALGFSRGGITRALASTRRRPWVWATEFENVHDMWTFHEPRIQVGRFRYENCEDYYHSQKPDPFNANVWDNKRVEVMMTGLRAKFNASKEAREVLLKSYPHLLLSIKKDAFWGFDPDPGIGGENMLAKLLMALREELWVSGVRPTT